MDNSSNLPPICFHEAHGEGLRLSRDKCLAEARYYGKVFTNRPVGINEKIFIRFPDDDLQFLIFRLTTREPVYHYKGKVNLSKPGNWGKQLNRRFTRIGLVLCLYVNEAGEVHYEVDGDDMGVWFDGVDTSSPLWGLFQFDGEIELIDPHRHR